MVFKKLNLLFVFCIALLLAGQVSANLDELGSADTLDTIVWPMLPNDSLSGLAAKFYPDNKAMQQAFIRKTKRLNRESYANLDPNFHFPELTVMVIPNLKSLSASVGAKYAQQPANNKKLKMSYSIESTAEKAKATLQNIPARLVEEYENLVERNAFLKEEIAKLNRRLIFLQNKLGELKLVLDKTLTLPSKKTLKNLDKEKRQVEKQPNKSQSHQKEVVATVEQSTKTSFFDLSNKFLWLGILGFGLLLALSSYLYKKYRERKYIELVNAISRQKQATTFSATEAENDLFEAAQLSSTSMNKETVVEEHNDQSVLQEAKTLMRKGLPEEAIGHLKWAIRAKPKTSINFWLYLLDILRQQNLKEEFEKYAFEMHQTFNVMTPLWEERSVAMVVAQTLEEFPYIIKLLTDKWPNEKITNYLQKLISDNRSGERSGFSQAVIEEILLLIDVLEVREPD
jgi:hypothetical protein